MQPQITVPEGVSESQIAIAGDGTVAAAGRNIGRIELVNVRSPQGLLSVGENAFVATAASGNAAAAPANTVLMQGALEGSNTDMASAMVEMIEAQRTYQLTSKAIQTADHMMEDRQRGEAMSIAPCPELRYPPTCAPRARRPSRTTRPPSASSRCSPGSSSRRWSARAARSPTVPYAIHMQDALTGALTGGRGLGLAQQLYKEMQSS